MREREKFFRAGARGGIRSWYAATELGIAATQRTIALSPTEWHNGPTRNRQSRVGLVWENISKNNCKQ